MSSKTGGGGSGSVPKHGSSSSLSQQEHHTLPPLLISDSSHIRDTLLCFTLDRSLLPVVGTDSGRRRHVRLLRRDVLPSENSDDDDDRRRRCRQKRAKISGREDSESDRTLRADCFGYASSHGKSSSQRSDRLVALLRKDTDEEDEYQQQQQQQQQSSKRDILENSISEGAMSSLTNQIRNEDVQTKKLGRKWETWQISLEMWDEDALLVSSRGESLEKQRERAANDLAETLSGTITHILALCEEKKEHVRRC